MTIEWFCDKADDVCGRWKFQEQRADKAETALFKLKRKIERCQKCIISDNCFADCDGVMVAGADTERKVYKPEDIYS